jgi:hypothetical protein
VLSQFDPASKAKTTRLVTAEKHRIPLIRIEGELGADEVSEDDLVAMALSIARTMFR